MEISKKNTFLFSGMILLIVLSVGIYMMFFSARMNKFFVIYEDVTGLEKGAPVFIDHTVVGKVSRMAFLKRNDNPVLIEISLNDDINIPDKSSVEMQEGNDPIFQKVIAINLVPSPGYYRPGDTIPILPPDEYIEELVETSTNVVNSLKSSLNTMKEQESKKSDQNSDTGIKFKVQFFISRTKLSPKSEKFKGIENIEIYQDNGLFKYTAGIYNTSEEAQKMKDSIRTLGFNDAFVVAFEKGKRISIEEALSVTN